MQIKRTYQIGNSKRFSISANTKTKTKNQLTFYLRKDSNCLFPNFDDIIAALYWNDNDYFGVFIEDLSGKDYDKDREETTITFEKSLSCCKVKRHLKLEAYLNFSEDIDEDPNQLNDIVGYISSYITFNSKTKEVFHITPMTFSDWHVYLDQLPLSDWKDIEMMYSDNPPKIVEEVN